MIWKVVNEFNEIVYRGESESLALRYWGQTFSVKPDARLVRNGRVIARGRPTAPDSDTPTTAPAIVKDACAALRKLGASAVKAKALIDGACADGEVYDNPAKLIEAALRYNVKGSV